MRTDTPSRRAISCRERFSCRLRYVAPAEYQTYIDPWINIDASNIWFDGTAGSGQWGIDDYASAGVEVRVFTIDKDVDAAYYANYIDRLRAIATNYPKKLIGTFRK